MSRGTDHQWIIKQYKDLQKKFPNKYVAVKDERVVFADSEYGKTKDTASKVCSDFVIEYILSGEPVVLTPYLQHSTSKV